jgi:hypothetical protein
VNSIGKKPISIRADPLSGDATPHLLTQQRVLAADNCWGLSEINLYNGISMDHKCKKTAFKTNKLMIIRIQLIDQYSEISNLEVITAAVLPSSPDAGIRLRTIRWTRQRMRSEFHWKKAYFDLGGSTFLTNLSPINVDEIQSSTRNRAALPEPGIIAIDLAQRRVGLTKREKHFN